MTAGPAVTSNEADVRVIEELLRVLSKGQRALQMYLPNNPVYQRAMQQVADAFGPVWGITGRLVLGIEEDQITWDEVPVYRQQPKSEGLAWQLYKDGLRRLTLLPGVESEEILRFLQVANSARMLPVDASDDLLTLLWEQEFVLISYVFIEVLGDGMEFLQDSDSRDEPLPPDAAKEEVAAAEEAPPGSDDARGGNLGVVDLTDFDATPYFLHEAEIRLVQTELEEEYRRDIRQAAIDALLDILEGQRDSAVRKEAIALLDDILPVQLSTGGFRAVARIIRELRVISARAHGLDQELHGAVLSFEERLSTPEILDQLFRVLGDMASRPAEEDVGEVLRELKPSALPAVLTQLGRITEASVRRVLEGSVESIARAQPHALAALLDNGPTDALVPAISLASRLGLSNLVPVIIARLKDGDEPIRMVAVRVLGEFGTPSAVAAMELALADPDRGVRQMALTALVDRGGSGGMVAQLERLLFTDTDIDWERSERRAMYEAYGRLAGDGAITRLRGLLEPRGLLRRREPAEIRACALFALGKVRTIDARMLVDRFTSDRDAVVRSAANAVLREWVP
ncbi:MAG TPA: HEAT repeat domain-containing protein [Gemmatimonadales bacterium]